MERWSSPIVKTLEDAWEQIAKVYPDTPEVVITVQTKGKNPVNGHFAQQAWLVADADTIAKQRAAKHKAEGAYRPEVMIAAEGLNREAEAVFVTLLHESVHAVNWVRKVKDTDTRGRRHNRRFRSLAEDYGMVCEDHQLYGCVTTGELEPEARKTWAKVIARLDEVLKANRREFGAKAVVANRNYIKLMCECGRVIRMAPKVASEGPVTCGNCGTDFYSEEGDDV